MSIKDEKYTLEITKRLDSFKNAREWPDFISLLTQLDSIISQYALPYIPKKELLCKRLNQCLNPLLPAGVHKKGFETYSIIFRTLSEEELVSHFGVYTLGLLNFGSHSRILVMGSYLDLLDEYIIPLGSKIESHTINVLFGILPSMESESSEYYKKGLFILQKFKDKININLFYTSLWNIFLQCGSLRLSVILFFTNSVDDNMYIDNKYLIVKALKEGLQSPDLLVLRNTLDLILAMFPIKKKFFTDSMNSELLEGMFQIFSRREQSLNKRIFSWIHKDDKIIIKTLSRILRTRSTTHYFFKIFITLSDKTALAEKILEDLLFEVLVYTKDYIERDVTEIPILERKKEYTQQDLIDLGKNFFTADLDRLWKVFYMELKKELCIVKKRNKSADNNLTSELEDIVSFRIIEKTNENSILENTSNLDIIKSNFKIEDIINSDLKIDDIKVDDIKVDDIKVDDIKVDDINNRDLIIKDINNKSSTLLSTSSSNLISTTKKKRSKIKKIQKETKGFKSPSEVLSYINFCTKNYSVYDTAVLKIHLPILISFVLGNYTLLDEDVVMDFLSRNIPKMILVDQSEEECKDFFRLIDDFYTNENAKILKEVQSSYMSLISKYLIRHLDETNYNLCIIFYQINKEHYYLETFLKNYYEWMVTKRLSVIHQSLCLFNQQSTMLSESNKEEIKQDTNFNVDLLFKELWSRFIKGVEGSSGPVWNITHLETSLTNLSANNLSTTRNMLSFDKSTNLLLFDKDSQDKGLIVSLIFEYNKVFKRKYERLLIKKVSEQNKHNICLFLHHVLGLSGNESYYFYNIFLLLNSKISGRDPVLTSLIKSINSFKGIISYIFKKFMESNVKSVDYVLRDKPNISQIKGILKLLKNCLINSRRFRIEISNTCESKEFDNTYKNNNENHTTNIFYNNSKITKVILFDILFYIFLLDTENLYLDDSIRNLKIQCLRMIQFLIDKGLITKGDIDIPDDILIMTVKKYKFDPALSIPIGDLISLRDDINSLLQYASILDSSCFYYYDLLEVIYKLDVRHVYVILPFILDNLNEGGYSFMIQLEVISKMVQLSSSNFYWALITKNMIQKFLNFYREVGDAPIVIDGNNLDNQYAKNIEDSLKNNLDIYKDSSYYIICDSISKISEILFTTFSGYYIEYLINSSFNPSYIKSLPFRDKLYAEILSSYSINQDKAFRFLLSFNNICTFSQRLTLYNKSINTLYQITNYRTFTDCNTLLYLLNIYSILPEESSQFLSIIYQSLAHMQRVNINRSDKLVLIGFLSRVDYSPKIRSALSTFLGFIFDLLKTSDKVMKSLLIDYLIIISDNSTITIKNIKTHLVEYLASQDFFFYKLREKAILYKKIFDIDLNLMDELVYKLESSFFTSQTADINNKCTVLKRISFLIFSNDFNKFAGFNSKFIEICVALLQHNSIKVRRKTWFLVKMICLKIDHNKLLPLFPVILTEILIFLDNCKKPDNPEYSSIVKLIDLLFVLNTSATFEFKNTCITDSKKINEGRVSNDKSIINDKSDKDETNINTINDKSDKDETNINTINDKSDNVGNDDQIKAYNKIEDTVSRPIFYKIYENIKNEGRDYNLNMKTKHELKRLFFLQKIIKSEDIISFFKYASIFYNTQEKKTSQIDIELVEKYILSEFHD